MAIDTIRPQSRMRANPTDEASEHAHQRLAQTATGFGPPPAHNFITAGPEEAATTMYPAVSNAIGQGIITPYFSRATRPVRTSFEMPNGLSCSTSASSALVSPAASMTVA